MGRAEMRRMQKAAQRKQNTYTLTQSQIEQLKQVAYEEAIAEAMKLMLTIPLEVLAKDYWPRSAEKRCPGFVQKVLDLYERYEAGEVSMESMVEDLWIYGGVRFETEKENTK
jgi:hypothetical protein